MTEKPSKPLISVIVPIYNAEKTLQRCLDSIFSQTLSDWELLLVNDGSTDGSGALCDDYAARDGRVRVIHKPNEGVAATRMRGIENAWGTYSIQVDADDWAESGMLEGLYSTALQEDADIVICDLYEDYAGRKPLKYVKQQLSGLGSNEVLADLLSGRRLKPYCWNKLVRHECYDRFGVRIPHDISHGEDFLIGLSLLRQADVKIAYHPQAYYHYMHDENSNALTRTYTALDFERDRRLKDHCLEVMAGHEYYPQVEQRTIFHFVRRAFNGGIFTSEEFKELTYDYRHKVRTYRDISWHRRWRLYLSCIGAYRLMYGYRSMGNMVRRATARHK